MPPRASTVVKTAALLMAAPALLFPMRAAAQQMSLGGPPGAAAAISDCQKLSTGAERDRCSMKVVIEENNRLSAEARARTAAAEARGVAADTRIRVAEQKTADADLNSSCAADITAMRESNPAATEIGRELVKASGRPSAEYGICRLRDGIRAGLAARR